MSLVVTLDPGLSDVNDFCDTNFTKLAVVGFTSYQHLLRTIGHIMGREVKPDGQMQETTSSAHPLDP